MILTAFHDGRREGHRCAARAVLLLAIAFCCTRGASAQRISSASTSRITDSAPSARTGAIASGPGGETIAGSSYTTSQANATVVSGRLRGYGEKANVGVLGETAAPGGPASFSSSGDFPDTDFVATLPRPVYAPQPAGKNGYGLTVFTGSASGTNAFSGVGSGGHFGAPSMPASHIKTSDAILNPFTHTIGTGFGAMPTTVLGATR